MQETHFKDSDDVNIRGFDHYFKTCMSEVDGRATGGCSIFVKKGIPHGVLELDTELQAVAVKVSLYKTITVCNVYIPPRFNVAQSDIDNLVNHLPAPFLFIGDFNAHSDLGGCSSSNSLGYKVEHLLESSSEGPRWQSGNTLSSHLCGRGSIPVMAVSGKAGSCLPLVGSLQYRTLANYMYWFPLPFQLPVVI